MPNYSPPAPWNGPYPQDVTDEYGNQWIATGPGRLKKKPWTPTIPEDKADCCHYHDQSAVNIDPANPPQQPPSDPAGADKSLGDTLHVCHPNGSCYYSCTAAGWKFDFCKTFPDVDPVTPPEVWIGETEPDKDAEGGSYKVWFNCNDGCVYYCQEDGTWLAPKGCPAPPVSVCEGAGTRAYAGDALLAEQHVTQPYNTPLPGAGYKGDACTCGTPVVKCDATNTLKGAPEHDRVCYQSNSGVLGAGELTTISGASNVVAESALVSATNFYCRIMRGLKRVEGRARVSHTDGNSQVIGNQQLSINGGNFSSAENDMLSNLDGQNIQVALVADRSSCQNNVQPGAVVTLQARLNLNVIGPNTVQWSDAETSALIDVSTSRI